MSKSKFVVQTFNDSVSKLMREADSFSVPHTRLLESMIDSYIKLQVPCFQLHMNMISKNVLNSSSHLRTPDLLLHDTLQKALTLHASGQWVISTEPLIFAYYSSTLTSIKKPNKFPEGDTLVNKDTWQRTDPTVYFDRWHPNCWRLVNQKKLFWYPKHKKGGIWLGGTPQDCNCAELPVLPLHQNLKTKRISTPHYPSYESSS